MSDAPDRDASRYAAAVLRGLKDRIDELENQVRPQDAVPNILRSVVDEATVGDTVAVTLFEAAGDLLWDTNGTWDGTDEWG